MVIPPPSHFVILWGGLEMYVKVLSTPNTQKLLNKWQLLVSFTLTDLQLCAHKGKCLNSKYLEKDVNIIQLDLRVENDSNVKFPEYV